MGCKARLCAELVNRTLVGKNIHFFGDIVPLSHLS
jgi:hypothetical protein